MVIMSKSKSLRFRDSPVPLGSAQVVAHNLNGFAQLRYQAAVGVPVILTGLALEAAMNGYTL